MSHEVPQAEGAPSAQAWDDDGEVDRLIAAIDARLSAQVCEVLRHPRFVALEAAWRELWFLIERVDFRENIRVEVLDCSNELLRARRWSVRVTAHGEPPAAFVELPRLAKIASWSDIADAVHRVETQPFRVREVGPREAWFDIDHPTRWPAVLAERTVAIYLPPPWSPGRVTVELWARCMR